MDAPGIFRTDVSGIDWADAVRPWRTLALDPLDPRRRQLYKLAAPVFCEHGYRGATIKALAHACHLTPAGLYHYFAVLHAGVVRQPPSP